MKQFPALFLVSALALMASTSPSAADGFDFYWHSGDRGPGWHHPRPHGPDYDRDLMRWHGGRWIHDWHDGRWGWWWVADGYWYMYDAPVYPYPDLYAAPVYIAQPTTTVITTPAPAVVATPAPTVVTTTQPVTTTTTTTAPSSSGTEVHFTDAINATTASSSYVDTQGRTCRDYKTNVVNANGMMQQATGKACLQPDGRWIAIP